MNPTELTNISVTNDPPVPGAAPADPATGADSKGSGTEIPPDHLTAGTAMASTGSGTELPPDHSTAGTVMAKSKGSGTEIPPDH